MKALRVSVALFFVVLLQLTPSFAVAQIGELTFSNRYDGRLLGPGRGAGLFVTVANTTDTPIVVSGVTMTDLVTPETCPRHWFGDAGYPDRPRGENETTPPVPAYPLPSAWLDTPITLEPGEAHELPMLELFMIEAAPNACQRISLSPVLDVAWEFVVVQTYGTVSGTVTDASSGEPIIDASVTISGTTDAGLVSEQISVDGSGTYTSANSYYTNSELTVTADSDGYTSASGSTTIVEGTNVVNVSLQEIPVATGTVSGSIVNSESGQSIANAAITISGVDAGSNSVSETVYSNETGNFSSTLQFQAGTIADITVSAEGYSRLETNAALIEGNNTIDVGLTAVQEEGTTLPSTPPPTEPGTPEPEPKEPGTPEPEPTEPGSAEPVPTEPEIPLTTPDGSNSAPETPIAPERDSTEAPIVSTLPSTGTGGSSHTIWLLGSALTSATLLAAGIRRHRN